MPMIDCKIFIVNYHLSLTYHPMDGIIWHTWFVYKTLWTMSDHRVHLEIGQVTWVHIYTYIYSDSWNMLKFLQLARTKQVETSSSAGASKPLGKSGNGSTFTSSICQDARLSLPWCDCSVWQGCIFINYYNNVQEVVMFLFIWPAFVEGVTCITPNKTMMWNAALAWKTISQVAKD